MAPKRFRFGGGIPTGLQVREELNGGSPLKGT